MIAFAILAPIVLIFVIGGWYLSSSMENDKIKCELIRRECKFISKERLEIYKVLRDEQYREIKKYKVLYLDKDKNQHTCTAETTFSKVTFSNDRITRYTETFQQERRDKERLKKQNL